MSAHLKRQHNIDEKSEALDSKTVKIHQVLKTVQEQDS